jgi:hypothetical protein
MPRALTPILLLILLSLAACNLSAAPEQEVSINGESESAETAENAENADTELTAAEAATATRPLIRTRAPAITSLPQPGQATPSAGTVTGTSQTVALGAPVMQAVGSGQQGYVLRVGTNAITGGGANLLSVDIDQFSQSPAGAERYAVIDQAGMLYITGPAGAGAFRVEQGPYTRFPATSRETNNAAAVDSRWSPNGQYVAFLVAARQLAADGLWYFEPGQFGPLQLIVDCPYRDFIGCNIVRPSPEDNLRVWESRELYWSPESDAILVVVNLPEEGRRGLILRTITREERVRDQRPPIWFWDYGTFAADGRIIASGANPDGAFVIDVLNRDGDVVESVYRGGAADVWFGWAAERPDGSRVALGRPSGPTGPVALYDFTAFQTSGSAVTPPIGDGFPTRVEWSADRAAVLIEVGGRQYVADLAGNVVEITTQTGRRAVNWGR